MIIFNFLMYAPKGGALARVIRADDQDNIVLGESESRAIAKCDSADPDSRQHLYFLFPVMVVERIRQRAGNEALFDPSSGTSGRCLVLQVMSGAVCGVVASIEFDQPGPLVKVLVTLPSGASARSEFPLDGPEAKDIAALEYENWVVKVDRTNLARLWTGLGGKLDLRFDS